MLSGILEQCAKVNLHLLKLSGIVADGTPSMIGSKSVLVTLLKQHLGRRENELIQFHCLIHQENLCAKSLGFELVMKVVISRINFIKSRSLNHRQFNNFLGDIENKCDDLIFVSEIRQLSRGQALERFLTLLNEFQKKNIIALSCTSTHRTLFIRFNSILLFYCGNCGND